VGPPSGIQRQRDEGGARFFAGVELEGLGAEGPGGGEDRAGGGFSAIRPRGHREALTGPHRLALKRVGVIEVGIFCAQPAGSLDE
jgi:hypothetical protein